MISVSELIEWVSIAILIVVLFVVLSPIELFGLLMLSILERLGFPHNIKTGAEGLVGRIAIVVKPFEHTNKVMSGKVQINGELWNAYTDNSFALSPGDKVKVDSVERLNLYVSRIDEVSN